MSDQTNKTGDGVIDTHYCCIDGCGKWGGLGFSRSKAEIVQWWCAEHYPHWQNKFVSRNENISADVSQKNGM